MAAQSVLIVDDEPDIRELLDITLSRMGLETHSAASLGEAQARISEVVPDLCLTDMKLPDGNGISLVEYIQRDFPQMPVAMITAHGSVETAISALKAGAFDFISKPIELETLRNLVNSALQLEGDTSRADSAVDHDLIGSAPSVERLRKQIIKLARSQAPVHIRGESGSGKEVVARLIHNNGPRAAGSFVAVNCGAIPPDLMESELFGHVKGSFTGATSDKPGLFQAAAGGTLFLDEVADLPLGMQVKLLRAIQEKSVRPVGASEEQPTDVRLLSATHKNLAAEVEVGRFRNDLYYRINVIDVQVPSLRERREDLPALAKTILGRISSEEGTAKATLDASALDALASYDFPGNVRELENVLERAFALSDSGTITGDDLQFPSNAPVMRSPGTRTRKTDRPGSEIWNISDADGDLEGFLEDIERKVLSSALEENRWNRTAAAKQLGISFRSLRYRLKKLGLDD
ncbi:sigma-54-dependent Fis family transcriptional regulator [Halioglobus japonicus]|uniref:Sigma-54-dependent Fis family transcriptional regulator n=1 Tax=Halioglobus japonicus TaxID=930805 RepID=A0AAP8SLK2_9GAMM|nr:sigma-54 dependent transcriptional regulator [Halioglobus japonicus]AQA19913.1 sigma-54-dependent Fis family transcriptional regulator [Halioglobus japonicus]PLW84644.1 sigma-54-dependent Fis family transcriptional regulator [Halioglobus japonicus]GHD23212.1 type 4 fimbriae expression regulatory protein PilR [Halioglobus japonicus]